VTAEPSLDLLVPGDLRTLTGGYIYDRRITEGLATLGWHITVRPLDSSFPFPTDAALAAARATLEEIPAGKIVVIDGLALGGMPDLLTEQVDRLRLVALIHHPLAFETGLTAADRQTLRRAERRSLAAVCKTVVSSRWTRQQLAHYGVPGECIHVVTPGTDPARLARGSGSTSVNLLCVATLTPRKGHAVLFDALAQLRDRAWHLHCVGSLQRDATTVSALREQISRLGLTERVSLLGEVTAGALAECYESADLFVLASHLEGYGMVLAEAVSHGLPIVCTSVGAVPETVAPGTALLVPEGSSAALAQALAKVLDDRRVLRDLAGASRIARDKLPTWEQACMTFAAALRELA
jgi:glycosyltransferase involved in cell wall biosynthesis